MARPQYHRHQNNPENAKPGSYTHIGIIRFIHISSVLEPTTAELKTILMNEYGVTASKAMGWINFYNMIRNYKDVL